MAAYYNEIDPYAAQWLRNLIAAGHIADGVVDERDIRDVKPIEIRDFTQCHFFAGIGIWSHALRRAGWPDDRPVWTGSCPCQPFSAAGRGKGTADERHLWPHWHHLIRECGPLAILGEQVASKSGRAWFDLVSADLEALDYACGAVDLCAAGVDAPNIRQRLNFCADGLADTDQWMGRGRGSAKNQRTGRGLNAGGRSPSERVAHTTRDDKRRKRQRRSGEQSPDRGRGSDCRLGHPGGAGLQGRTGMPERANQRPERAGGLAGGMADTEHGEQRQGGGSRSQNQARNAAGSQSGRCGSYQQMANPDRPMDLSRPVNGFWADIDWLLCRDGKWRPVEAGTFPLADGDTNRVGKLRAYGNALNAETTTEFIRAVMDAGLCGWPPVMELAA